MTKHAMNLKEKENEEKKKKKRTTQIESYIDFFQGFVGATINVALTPNFRLSS